MKRLVQNFSFFLLFFIFLFSTCSKEPKPYYYQEKGIVIAGYDTVAFFTQNRAIKGSSQHQVTWDNGVWYFSSEQNKELFLASPADYVPQYGGYCAWAMSKGNFSKVDPVYWKIHENKLYLNYNKNITQKWLKNIPGFIENADMHWKKLSPQLR
ncbi:MAG: YHS domain protein [Spirochaetes bacterium]|nr:YHS domain protein [Spirochaetota bacterium]